MWCRACLWFDGGGVVHLFDSVNKHQCLETIFCHHEQAASLAAISYARITNNLGVVIVTTGPGGTNTITGLLSAWQDSIPCLFISGQSRKSHSSHGKGLRQLGTQEFDIVNLVQPITKYAVMVDAPDQIRVHLEKALYYAFEGRPGPVWVDLPLDFQWSEIDEKNLESFNDIEISEDSFSIENELQSFFELFANAIRPLVLVGYGVRLSKAQHELKKFLERFQIPFVSTWTASDLLPSDVPIYVGRPGIVGQRGANLAIQNCDLLIALGSHLSIPVTGTLFESFAREAKVVMVDIDSRELEHETVKVDLPVNCDVKVFLQKLLTKLPIPNPDKLDIWRDVCSQYKKFNLISKNNVKSKGYICPYSFIDILSDFLSGEDVIVVDGGGTNMYTSFQAFKVLDGQRLILSSAIGSMGTGLPESVGACFANKRKRTICLVGDGSLQLNIQELQTIFHYDLPVKIFVMNNDGYLAIRHTQAEFLEENFIGSHENGGVSLPDYQKVSAAYGIKALRVSNHNELVDGISWSLEQPGSVLCEVMVSPDQQLYPRQGFDKNSDGSFCPRPLEDMYPFLERDVFLANMFIESFSEKTSISR